MAETFLERIVAATRADLDVRRAQVSLVDLRARAAEAPPPRPFADALRPTPTGSARLIAEVKRASPSKGLLAEQFEPVAQAQAYARGGAAAISVLTEPHFFLGALEHLRAVRAAVDVPVLRKDFVLDAYQVYEARVAGADALLLICALLDDAALRTLLQLTRSLGMEALVEAHTAAEVQRAVAAGATVVGVNSRDLKTFHVDTEVVRHLRPLVPADCVFVAESGIGDARGAAIARAWGADAVLVGEALMRAADPQATAQVLATAPGGATAAFFADTQQPFIKICGLMRPEHAALVAEAGAAAFGLIFAPSKRRVAPEQARALVVAARGVRPEHGRAARAVGVFVNESAATMASLAAAVVLDAVQLSGDESPDDCAEVAALSGLPVLKALRLRTEADLALLDVYALAGATLLLDTPAGEGIYGGTGQTSDWSLAHRAAQRWPVILSGGLHPANVGAALAAVVPRGVDVSSGVETDGVKDERKIRAFLAACGVARTASSV